MAFVSHQVGRPHPGPVVIADGMQAILAPTEGGLSLTLLTAVPRPSSKELAALRDAPLRIGLYSSPPLAWILLDAGAISFDAPYAIGITPPAHRDAILTAAKAINDWSAAIRGLVSVDVIDPARTNRIEVLRAVTLSREWWQRFAATLITAAGSGSLDSTSYRAAIASDSQLNTANMFARASAVEIGGRS